MFSIRWRHYPQHEHSTNDVIVTLTLCVVRWWYHSIAARVPSHRILDQSTSAIALHSVHTCSHEIMMSRRTMSSDRRCYRGNYTRASRDYICCPQSLVFTTLWRFSVFSASVLAGSCRKTMKNDLSTAAASYESPFFFCALYKYSYILSYILSTTQDVTSLEFITTSCLITSKLT